MTWRAFFCAAVALVLAGCATPCGDGSCAAGQICASSGDCQSGVCERFLCAAASCSDGRKNGAETDVDCGGPCGTCPDYRACAVGGDCRSGTCSAGRCREASCTDGLHNGAETDVDCGGPCGSCALGTACQVDRDCQSLNCGSGRCAAAWEVSSLAPTQGPSTGGTVVSVDGVSLRAAPGLRVLFGDMPGSNLQVLSTSQLVVMAPLAAAIGPLLDDRARRAAMGAIMRTLAKPNAAAAVVEWCEAQQRP